MTNMFPLRSVALLLTLAVVPGVQPPPVINGRVAPQPAGTPFAESFRQLVSSRPDVTWIGYSVPAVDGERTMCCGDSGSVWVSGSVVSVDRQGCCTSCTLEPSNRATQAAAPRQIAAQPVPLEPASRMNVLFRVADRRVERIRVFSAGCELDAGGREVIWLQDIRPADSITLLESLAIAGADDRDRVQDGAVAALALHADTAADGALDRLLTPATPEALRRKVTFWLGNARGARGLATLRRVLQEDPSLEVRKSAVFGVSQSGGAGGFDLLADLARRDASGRIRSEAVFWIAQRQEPHASAVILETLDNDPEPDVRRKAVFALGQLRNDAGVEPLIRTARTHGDPAIRGEAIFWLAQKAGRKASSAITERIEQDPDTEVKKRAVFALSQLPKDEGVPLLIQVARTNTNPAVRKQAMFWLGQSKDPRAIDFFAEILK